MRITKVATIAVILCVFARLCAADATSESNLTFGEYLVQTYMAMPLSYHDVCVAANPSQRQQYDQDLSDVQARIRQVAEPLLKRYLPSDFLKAPVGQDLADQVRAAFVNQRQLVQQRFGDGKYCPTVMANMRNLDAEAIRSGFEPIVSQAVQALKQQQSNSK
jgi:hypothetical protein